MDHRRRTYLSLFLLLAACVSGAVLPPAHAQQGYEVSVRPDLWYNDVDGIRIGSIFEGRVPGTHEEGPHRLDAGFWVSTWFPTLPVSYLVRYTEPVPAWSDYGSEFSLQLLSSVREGYHLHGLSLNKRWQDPFEYLNYWEAGTGFQLERRFDAEYAAFPELWSEEWKGILQPWISRQQMTGAGLFNLHVTALLNTFENTFQAASAELTQQVGITGDWQARIRVYGSLAGSEAHPEYLQLLSSGAEINTLDSRISRSKGSVPVSWVRNGHVHFSGGSNLRGYRRQDVEAVTAGLPPLYDRTAAYNLEFDFPNPVQRAIRGSQMEEFISFRSYLFTDGAFAAGEPDTAPDGFFADAGAGLTLSLNIPDYLGRPRGFVIRYEMPFWLSDPANGEQWEIRHLLGFGATITF